MPCCRRVLTQNYRCQLCIILATDCQNLGRLNRKLSEVLGLLRQFVECERINCFDLQCCLLCDSLLVVKMDEKPDFFLRTRGGRKFSFQGYS